MLHCKLITGLQLTVCNTSRGSPTRSIRTTSVKCSAAWITTIASAWRWVALFPLRSLLWASQEGYCGVTYREVSGTTPDAFNLLPNPSPGTVVTCPASFINIPKLRCTIITYKSSCFTMLRSHFRQHSDDGITGLGAPTEAFFDFSSVIVSIPPSFRLSYILSISMYVSPLLNILSYYG